MTRDELLDEAEAVWLELEDFHHRCSDARLRSDTWYRWAYAFLWLRLTEPLSQLSTNRLVGRSARVRWGRLVLLRNELAHSRLAEIDYVQLWDDFADVRATLPAELASLR